ncbi:hypothetical protein RQP46_006945 [Phenoliferia psychrophenolica]
MPPRKEKVIPGNPQWIEWIEELADKEEEKGSKAAETYRKGAKALKLHPIPYAHPESASVVTGIGPTTIKYLVKKMEAECERNGTEMPERVVKDRAPPKKKAAVKKRARKDADSSEEERAKDVAKEDRRARTKGAREALPGPPLPAAALGVYANIAANAGPAPGRAPAPSGGRKLGAAPAARRAASADSDDDNDNEPAQKKKKGKEYVPRMRSGPFGILVGLYVLSSFDVQENWVTKPELIEVASDYSENSYTEASKSHCGKFEGGGQHSYTAWSSMTTVVDKNLVQRDKKRPERFALTDKGYTLAELLIKSTDVEPHQRRGGPSSGTGGANGVASGSGSNGKFSNQLRRAPSYDFGNDDDDHRHVETPDEIFARQMQEAMERSRHDSQPRSNDEPRRNPVALPQPRAMVPLPKPRHSGSNISGETLDYDLSSNGSSRDAAGGNRPRPSGSTLDPRKAAGGSYATSSRPAEAAIQHGGTDGLFHFYYLDEDGNRQTSRFKAETWQDEQQQETFRVEFPCGLALHRATRQMKPKPSEMRRAVDLPGGKTLSGFLPKHIALDTAPGFEKVKSVAAPAAAATTGPASHSGDFSSLMKGKAPPPKVDKNAMYKKPAESRRLVSESDSDDDMQVDPPVHRPPPPPAPPKASTSSSYKQQPAPAPAAPRASTSSSLGRTQSAPATTANARAGPSLVNKPAALARSLTSIPSPPHATSTAAPMRTSYDRASYARSYGSTIVNRHPLDPVMDHISETTVFPEINPIVLRPGTFKVVLVVDTREIRGTKTDNKDIITRLTNAGVNVEQKMLPIGDFIWVARRVHSNGTPTGEDDIVLDAVVERKRLDDLCKSIIDGRYTGQKIRMKNSAITDRIYLIEKWDSATAYKEWGPQIWTAKSQLQINDGFYVHITNNVQETIDFLRLRTQVMTELYESSVLYALPDRVIDRVTFLGLQQHLRTIKPDQSFLTSYKSFSLLNGTDAGLTLRQHWASMIQRVNGMSAEKAVCFINRWSTPKQFFDECMAHERKVERENRALDAEAGPAKGKAPKKRKVEDFVVEELAGEGGQRAIKGALAAKLWHLFAARDKYPAKGASP